MSAEPIRLVEPAQTKGDDDGFCVLYRRYYARVRGLAARRFPAFDADDVAQETMLRVLVHAHRLDPQRDPWPYIAAISVNVARDFARNRAPEVELTEESYDRELAPAADEPVLVAERSERVKKVLDGLAPGSRQVLALQAYDEMSVGEIARFLGTNDNAVRQKLFRARTQFRRALAGVPSGSLGITALVFAVRRRIAAANLAGGPGLSVAGAAIVAAVVAGAVTVGVTSGDEPGGARTTPNAAAPAAVDATRAGDRPATPAGGRGTNALAGGALTGADPSDGVVYDDVSKRPPAPPTSPQVKVGGPRNPLREPPVKEAEIFVPTPMGDLVIRHSSWTEPGNSTACSVYHVPHSRICR